MTTLVPTGNTNSKSQPSRADEMLTKTLQQALGLIDVRVLDHLIVATGGTVSLAERGVI